MLQTSADQPSASRNEGNKFRVQVACQEGAEADGRDCRHGRKCEGLLEQSHPDTQPEQMHQIHAVRQSGHVCDPLGRFLLLDACEH
mgnify:CR=1 FL=1